ncbi:MAG: hypothetical protein ACRD16_12085 [Thermoanaerobaculia bacterium]
MTNPAPAEPSASPEERFLRRVKRTAIVLATLGACAAGAFQGGAAAVSLTAGAAVVIFSFYFLERVTARILVPRIGTRPSDFAVPAVGFLALAALLAGILSWKGFDLVAGLAGFSVIVLAIGVEGLRSFGRA